MRALVTVSRQVHRADMGDGDIWSVQITIVARISAARQISASIVRGTGCVDAPSQAQADAEAWRAAVDDFCDAAWLEGEVEFEVMGQIAKPAAAARELNAEWRRRAMVAA